MQEFSKRFPIQAGIAAFLVYLATLAHGMTFKSMALTAKVAGWDWQPFAGQSLLWLVTLPIRLLPESLIPIALNLFAAIVGAAIIGLLARTMQLLNWDQPLTKLPGWAARIPLIFACLICGLEFNFWQESTSLSGEIFQLMFLAAAIWALMEYRASAHYPWLRLAALLWGMGMAENWMMFITLPLFVVAVFWLGKFRVFNTRVIVQLTLTGLAGFSVFALMPMVNGFNPHSPMSWGDAWLQALRNLKSVFAVVYYNFWRAHRLVFIAVVIFYLVPILTTIVRLRDEGTSNKAGVDRFQIWLYRGLMFFVLLACVWLAFDPVVGPQQIVQKQTGMTLAFLSLTYLLAISAGFLTGNLMLALGKENRPGNFRPNSLEKALSSFAVPLFTGMLLVTAFGLAAKNIPAITLPNRLPLDQFGKLALKSLPEKGGIVLSDDSLRLSSFQAAAGADHKWLPIDTRALAVPAYREWLARKYSVNWTNAASTNVFNQTAVLQLLIEIAAKNEIYYLHPSYGLFFEAFYAEPAGAVFRLKKYEDKSVNPPRNPHAIETTEQFWQTARPLLSTIAKSSQSTKPARNSLTKKIYDRLHFQPSPQTQGILLGEWYSLTLNDWGVTLQRNDQLARAGNWFQEAAALNPNNGAARINASVNSNLLARAKANLADVDGIRNQLGSLPQMTRFLAINGLVDDPSFCYVLGGVFVQAGLPRQALQQFERAHALAPEAIAPKLVLAELYTRLGFADKGREFITQARNDIAKLPQKNEFEANLSLLEADSWIAQTNAANARTVLQNLSSLNLQNPQTQSLVLRAFMLIGDFTNALEVINRQLVEKPNDSTARVNKAMILSKMRETNAALALMEQVVMTTNSPELRLLLNETRIDANQLDTAEKDYLAMQKDGLLTPLVLRDLAEIAYRRHDTNRTIEFLQQSLTNLPDNSPLIVPLKKRIEQLKNP